MEELDIENLKLEDIKIGGQALGQAVEPPAPEQVPQEVVEPSGVVEQPPVAPPVEPSKEVVEPVKAPEPAQYKFKDDFIKGLVEYYEKTGDATPYLQAKTVDFTKMSLEEIAKRDLRQQYPEISDKALDLLYKKEVVGKFGLDSDSEEEVELGTELFKTHYERKRNELLNWQKNFQPPVSEQEQEQLEQQRLYQEAFQKFEQETKSNDITRKLLNDKRIAVKIGEAEVNIDIANPGAFVEKTVDSVNFFKDFTTTDGKVDYQKWYRVLAYAQNPDLYDKLVYGRGQADGREEINKAIKNPDIVANPGLPTEGSSGDFITDLANAFATRGKHR